MNPKINTCITEGKKKSVFQRIKGRKREADLIDCFIKKLSNSLYITL